jgi:hypothetical protein
MRHSPGPPNRRPTGLFLAGLLGAFLAGCGQGAGLVPVTGKVTLDGKPLGTGTVTFHPDAAKGNAAPHLAAGEIDGQGNYKLLSDGKEGVPPGWYKVTVTAQEPADSKNPYAPPQSIVNAKYRDVKTSNLSVEVVGNPSPGAYDFSVTK